MWVTFLFILRHISNVLNELSFKFYFTNEACKGAVKTIYQNSTKGGRWEVCLSFAKYYLCPLNSFK